MLVEAQKISWIQRQEKSTKKRPSSRERFVAPQNGYLNWKMSFDKVVDVLHKYSPL